jgi:ribulose-phosphate 3-epimerase
MKMDPMIAASILAADFTQLGEQIQQAEAAGVDWLHIDVMDGYFVPNLTIGPMIVEACRRVTTLPLHVHLMVEEPERLLGAFADAGAASLTVHVETCPHLDQRLRAIHDLGLKAGVAINPSTPALLLSEVIDLADQILVMSVNPGFGGQTLIESVLEKVKRIRQMRDSSLQSQAIIAVDGGVNASTAARVTQAGGDVLVAGTAIFGHPAGIQAGVSQLRSAVNTPREAKE